MRDELILSDSLIVSVQWARGLKHRYMDQLPVTKGQAQAWVRQALRVAEGNSASELSIRWVDCEQSRRLNATYRSKDKSTNVLSFPSELPDVVLASLPARPLGDLVVCVPVVLDEATRQGKPALDHLAHLVIHGTLHLLGYDHETNAEAESMERLERLALAALDIADPY